jgi:inosose dehydratase
LDRIAAATAAAGLLAVLHPHVGTVVEQRSDVDRVLSGCGIQLCLDTGHLMIGGTDPVWLVGAATDRIGHVHLKDVDAAAAGRVADGTASYSGQVAAGMYRPLGTGDAGIAAVVSTLEESGYGGWYVMEQDTVLAADPPAGAGPVDAVRSSLAYLRGLDG